MASGKLSVERRGHVLLMGLNRPDKMNAFDVEMFLELASAMGELDRDGELRCGLLFAHGRHFTAGLDLPQWAPFFTEARFPDLPAGACDPFGLVEGRQVGKPMVMAVQGICYTIGLELMLAMDIRVAATDTRLGQIEVRRGIYPVGGATVRLHRELGWGNAMRYLLTGDEIPADEALRLGLVQELVEPGRQFNRALEIAETIARQAPLGVKASLKSARRTVAEGERAAIERLLPDLEPIMKSEDAAEGVRSFVERREARFRGR
ncbi:MAG: 2,3-dehydroadipyl-CoA hydratase [Syntrophaceae bacterium PtaB.Bin038]|nr:MAG: 2,3-dehydroadipyl-CoA hydratase [Syntrophaceae bacterium PtaB.Bin038]